MCLTLEAKNALHLQPRQGGGELRRKWLQNRQTAIGKPGNHPSHRLLSLFRLGKHVHHDAKLIVTAAIVDHAAESEASEVGDTATNLAVGVKQALHSRLPERVLVSELQARLLVGMRVLKLGS